MWELYYFSSIISTQLSDMELEEQRIINLKLTVSGDMRLQKSRSDVPHHEEQVAHFVTTESAMGQFQWQPPSYPSTYELFLCDQWSTRIWYRASGR